MYATSGLRCSVRRRNLVPHRIDSHGSPGHDSARSHAWAPNRPRRNQTGHRHLAIERLSPPQRVSTLPPVAVGALTRRNCELASEAATRVVARHLPDCSGGPGRPLENANTRPARIETNAVNFTVFAGQCLSSGKGVAAVMFWMTHCGLIQRR